MNITKKDLEATVNRINVMTNSPLEYSTRIDGKFKANIGNYHLDGAYGGWNLARVVNEGGGITNIFSCGHVSKRDLYNRMQAYINGLLDCK